MAREQGDGGRAPAAHVERRSDHVESAALRAMFRLEGELWELPRGSEAQRRHALEGLCALVGAQVGIWASFASLVKTNGLVLEAIHLGWSGEREQQTFQGFIGGGQAIQPDPSIARMAPAVRPPISTFTRQDLMGDREWYAEPHVAELRRAARVDAFLHSLRVDREAGYVISLHRPWGARRFTAREKRLVDLFHRESRALALPAGPAPEAVAPALPRHLDRTLRVLLRGLSEKQVAAELGLSPHTVHEYVGALYRHFRVGSRAELFARLAGARDLP